jgi:hypothetical protein
MKGYSILTGRILALQRSLSPGLGGAFTLQVERRIGLQKICKNVLTNMWAPWHFLEATK